MKAKYYIFLLPGLLWGAHACTADLGTYGPFLPGDRGGGETGEGPAAADRGDDHGRPAIDKADVGATFVIPGKEDTPWARDTGDYGTPLGDKEPIGWEKAPADGETPSESPTHAAGGGVRNDAGDDIGTPGFWCHQIGLAADGDDRALFPPAWIFEWIVEINICSTFYSEQKAMWSLEDARDVLCHPEPRPVEELLERHLLTLGFNLVSGQVLGDTRLDQLCRGEVMPPPDAHRDWTVGEVGGFADAALADPASDGSELFWKDVIDYINNARAPGTGDCPAP
jgi:hypothetical protein